MSRYSLEVQRIDAEGDRWYHVGNFSTADAASRRYSRSYSRTTTVARLVDRQTGVVHPVLDEAAWLIDEYNSNANGNFFSPEAIQRLQDQWASSPPPENTFRHEYEANFLDVQNQMQSELNRINNSERVRRRYEAERRVHRAQREAQAMADRQRRLSGFNFVDLEASLEKPKKKFKVEWWKDGF